MFRIACIAIFVAAVVATDWLGATARWLNQFIAHSHAVPIVVTPAAPPPPPGPTPLWLWLAITLALPIISMGFLRSVVRKRSNFLNAGTALLYLVIELLAATPFAPASVSLTSGLAWSALAAFSLTYTVGSMNLALHLES